MSNWTHKDCKGHTGAMMSLGGGAVISSSQKQKMNTKSSTELELVELDDALTTILWTLYFIEAQEYSIKQNIIFEDNLSMINLAVNGHSCYPREPSTLRLDTASLRTRLKKVKLRFNIVPLRRCGVMYLTNPSKEHRLERIGLC